MEVFLFCCDFVFPHIAHTKHSVFLQSICDWICKKGPSTHIQLDTCIQQGITCVVNELRT